VRRRLLLALAGAAVFVAGLVVGEALQDGSRPAGTQTLVRTLEPLPLAPAAVSTATVTVTVDR
jgi:hypothetical protein